MDTEKPYRGAHAPGIFITFEGGEGAGKSTHIRFLAEALEERGFEVLCLREPGGTAIGEDLRSIVLDPENAGLADEAELLIYEAARAQIVSEVIAPALERGAVVLCDRFYDSTVAYQVFGRGLDRSFVDAANRFASQGVRPDRTILLAVGGSADDGLKRATHHGEADRLELEGARFHARVNEGFMEIAAAEPDRIRVVASAARKSDTARAVFSELADLFEWMGDPACADDALFEKIDTGYYGNKKAIGACDDECEHSCGTGDVLFGEDIGETPFGGCFGDAAEASRKGM
ncbi:dTMP kinase [Raoultibacter phocaeensis]|uniref:dTMP kinase n=1 Tax=Raoultibacter phocaeensis TaxID=2479841 RepID=UPI00111888CF|nr:dTMP kinase [Raoultibacter phocaeensis]